MFEPVFNFFKEQLTSPFCLVYIFGLIFFLIPIIKRKTLAYPTLRYLKKWSYRKSMVRWAFALLICLILSLFGFVVFQKDTSSSSFLSRQSSSPERVIVVVFDVSSSMQPLYPQFGGGGEPPSNQYDLARKTYFELIKAREGDAIGVVIFSSESYIARYPTTNQEVLLNEIFSEGIEDPDSSLHAMSWGTKMEEAVQLAHDLLDGYPNIKEKAIIIFSDFNYSQRKLLRMVEINRLKNIHFHVVGIWPSRDIDIMAQELESIGLGQCLKVYSYKDINASYEFFRNIEVTPENPTIVEEAQTTIFKKSNIPIISVAGLLGLILLWLALKVIVFRKIP